MTPPVPSPPFPRRGAGATFLWILASGALLIGPVVRWLEVTPRDRLIVPQTPVDRTLGRYAEEWRFLDRAREYVPDGASLTVRAEHPQREVSLYILSLGLYPDASPIPATYYDSPAEQQKRRARFVLSLRCQPPSRTGLQPVARFPEGCVFQDRAVR